MLIDFSSEQNIGILRLNQPPANTMTMEFFETLATLLKQIEHTGDLHALIITGSGRHFSAGADIDELLKVVDEQRMLAHYHTILAIENLGIPVISAIRGVCLGAAFELVLQCNFRICANDAVLGMPESSFNLMPGLGGIERALKLARRAKAMELILTGTTFTAHDAFDAGLVDAVVSKQNLMPLTIQFAKSLPARVIPECRAIYLKKYFNPLMVYA